MVRSNGKFTHFPLRAEEQDVPCNCKTFFLSSLPTFLVPSEFCTGILLVFWYCLAAFVAIGRLAGYRIRRRRLINGRLFATSQVLVSL